MRVVTLDSQTDFEGWRQAARGLIADGVRPEDVSWSVGAPDTLFAAEPHVDDRRGGQPAAAPGGFTVPRGFLERCAGAILNRDPDRFAFLYRLLWRVRHEPGLAEVSVDADIVRLDAMVKAVRRDLHKMKAYVRFREVALPAQPTRPRGARPRPSALERAARDGGLDEEPRGAATTWYVAWFEPSHYIVEAVAPFFMRRFTAMHWAILTPDATATWDGEAVTFGPGADRSDAPDDDALEDLWRSYYASIFNPARLKLASMQGHMPKKYWKNLPEAELIAPLAAAARHRTQSMIDAEPSVPPQRTARVMRAAGHDAGNVSEGTAMVTRAPGKLPADDGTGGGTPVDPTTIAPAFDPSLPLAELSKAAKDCRACPLWEPATQTVFGEGRASARIVVVGEQPGDQEDIAGRPFVGPAGQLFDRALNEAQVDRKTMYVTNAVKHFKFIVRGKRRMHQSPKVTEIRACHPWLDAEIARLKPALVIAMGATAAQSVFGRPTPVEKSRRQFFNHVVGGHATRVVVTVHPSYLLRLPDEDAKAAAYAAFVEDLRIAHDSVA